MTKIEAIKKIIEDNGGVVSWEVIYSNIEKYYTLLDVSTDWKAGIRGSLYREIKTGKKFKKIGLGLFALKDYVEEEKPSQTDTARMHSYIEGICLEIGNFKNFLTYTADPNVKYRDNLTLGNVASISEIPPFSYPEIIREIKKTDVIWFNTKGLSFPQKIFEIVDSLGTLNNAFNRCLQLLNFRTEFFIVAPEQHKKKFLKTINLEPYKQNVEKFKFINYEQIIELYDNAFKVNKIEREIF